MDYVKHLTAKGRHAVAVLHRFYLAFDEAGSDSFIFVEGEEDEEFYSAIVREYVGKFGKITWLICDGKDAVCAILDDIKRKNMNCPRLLFFIDKDHDDFLGSVRAECNLYVTTYYSIENYVVDKVTFLRFLGKYMSIDCSDPLFDEASALFNKLYGHFTELMRPFMAWTIYVRRSGGKPNLSNVRLERCLRVSFDCGWRVEFMPSAKEKFSRDCGFEDVDFESAGVVCVLNELLGRAGKEYLRGKFETWFLVKVINSLSASWRGRTKINGKRVRLKIAVSSNNVMQLISDFSSYPSCLRAFLHDIVKQRAAASSLESTGSRSSVLGLPLLARCGLPSWRRVACVTSVRRSWGCVGHPF